MHNPIKRKFIAHMELYQLSKQTQMYLNNDQVLEYFRHLLLAKELAHSSCKAYLALITYFYRHICGKEVDHHVVLPPGPMGKELPEM